MWAIFNNVCYWNDVVICVLSWLLFSRLACKLAKSGIKIICRGFNFVKDNFSWISKCLSWASKFLETKYSNISQLYTSKISVQSNPSIQSMLTPTLNNKPHLHREFCGSGTSWRHRSRVLDVWRRAQLWSHCSQEADVNIWIVQGRLRSFWRRACSVDVNTASKCVRDKCYIILRWFCFNNTVKMKLFQLVSMVLCFGGFWIFALMCMGHFWTQCWKILYEWITNFTTFFV